MRRLLVVFGLAVFYAWLVASATPAEAVAALGSALAATLALAYVTRREPARALLDPAFVGPFVRRVLPAIVTESIELLGPVLWRRLVLRRPVAGRWIALAYDAADRSSAHEHVRRTIVVFGSNLTPNALPLDVDVNAGRLVLHQLVYRREAAASDPRYPM